MPDQPSIRAPQIRRLEALCAASAISGQEEEVRKIVKKELAGHVDEMSVDALGNVLIRKRGRGRNRLKVLLAAHMDEVGLIITGKAQDGAFPFATVGGLRAADLVGKPVVVGKSHIPGVIGFKPIHLTTAGERNNSVAIDHLKIDTGEAGGKVHRGDRVTFAPHFTILGRGQTRCIRAKALDDRIGVATLIELLKHAPANIDLLGAFTTQEEIGLRGARVAAHALNPDIAIALDCTPARDLPHWEGKENTRTNARLGAGPAIYRTDRGTLSDPRLIRHFSLTAEKHSIPFQYRQPGGGSTDAGAMHQALAGIPSISISVPGRYLHTPASIVRVSDWRHTLALIHHALSALSPALLREERE